MESLAEWKTYWWDVIAASFNWVVILWPIPTIILGAVIMLVTALVYSKLGRPTDAKSIYIAFAVGLAVSVATFVLFVLFIGPFLHFIKMVPSLTELETLRAEKKNLGTTIEELKVERDGALTQQKLFEEARDILRGELDKVRGELTDASKRLDDKRSAKAEKGRQKAIREHLGLLFGEGQALLRLCFTQVKNPAPLPEAMEWLNKTYEYVKREIGSADATQFMHPPMGPAGRSFDVPQDHDRLANRLDRHLNALRSIMGQQNISN